MAGQAQSPPELIFGSATRFDADQSNQPSGVVADRSAARLWVAFATCLPWLRSVERETGFEPATFSLASILVRALCG